MITADFAWTLGRADNQLVLDQALEHLRDIVSCVNVPVNADFEGGFADDPARVGANVKLAAATGIAGLSIEDSTRDGAQPLYEFDHAVERIRAARQAIDESGTGVVLTGRSEGFVCGHPDIDDTIRRLCACADAGVFLISPFVGRITDWYTANTDLAIEEPSDDPGVQSVMRIYNHFKTHDYQTVVMGASFRNTGQVEALAGCDRLTISPDLLQQLEADTGALSQRLLDSGDRSARPEPLGQSEFLLANNQDPMVAEKLSDGIRRFVADQQQLEALLGA